MTLTAAFCSRLVNDPVPKINDFSVIAFLFWETKYFQKVYVRSTEISCCTSTAQCNFHNRPSGPNVSDVLKPLTSFPRGPPACDVAFCCLQESVHWWGETDRLDGVGHGCWDSELQQSHVMIHAGAIKGWVDDHPLDRDDQGPHPRP